MPLMCRPGWNPSISICFILTERRWRPYLGAAETPSVLGFCCGAAAASV